MSEHYLQAFRYSFLEPCCIFSADPTWIVVLETIISKKYVYIAIVARGGDILSA